MTTVSRPTKRDILVKLCNKEEAYASIYDQPRNIILTLHARVILLIYFTLGDGANPSSKRRLYTMVTNSEDC